VILSQVVSHLLPVCFTHGNKCLRRTPLNNIRLLLQLSQPRFPRRPPLRTHPFHLHYIALLSLFSTLSEPFPTNLKPLRRSWNLKSLTVLSGDAPRSVALLCLRVSVLGSTLYFLAIYVCTSFSPGSKACIAASAASIGSICGDRGVVKLAAAVVVGGANRSLPVRHGS